MSETGRGPQYPAQGSAKISGDTAQDVALAICDQTKGMDSPGSLSRTANDAVTAEMPTTASGPESRATPVVDGSSQPVPIGPASVPGVPDSVK